MNLVFFTDRDLGKRFPEILAAAGLTVERHHDRFSPDGSDEEWLRYVGESGRVAITHNARIRYTPNELAAVLRYRVTLLVIVGKAPYPELAGHFVNTIPRIRAFLTRHHAPFIAKGLPAHSLADREELAGARVSFALVPGTQTRVTPVPLPMNRRPPSRARVPGRANPLIFGVDQVIAGKEWVRPHTADSRPIVSLN